MIPVLLVVLLLFSLLPLPGIEAKDEEISVVSPNGGQTLTAGSVRKITWSISGTGGYVGISYTTNGGRSYEPITAIANNPSHGYGSYDWNIPPTINSTKCKVQVVWVSSLIKPYTIYDQDESDDNFTIEKGVTITITEVPDSVSYGAYYFLKWTMFDPDDLVAGFKFEWRTDDGSGWSSYGSIAPYYDWYDPGAGYIWWTPPFFESGRAEIRISAYSEGNVTLLDQVSTGQFTIVSANVFLINPNGGVTMVAGSSYTLEWRTSDDPDEVIGGVYIHYTINDGGTWNYLHMGPNDFSETVTIPSITTTNFKVRIQTIYSEFSVYSEDISDFGNTIIPDSSYPSITLDFPNPPVPGGLIMPAGGSFDIEWSMTGASSLSYLSILLSTDNGTSYSTIVNYASAPSGPYTWTVPNLESFEAKIKVQATSISHGTVKGESIHPFYIVDPETFGNIPPIADAVPEYNVMEGTLVTLDASASYDPNGDLIVYSWELVSPPSREVVLDNSGTATPSFTPTIEDFEVNFVFELRLWDLKEYEGIWLYNVTRVSVIVTPLPPEIISVTPDTGWVGTEVELVGTNMKGCEVLIGEEMIASIPRTPNGNHPDPDNSFVFEIHRQLPLGVYPVTIRTHLSEDVSEDEIEIFPEPLWQYEHGLGFHNNATHTLSYPWNPWGTGRYRDVFENQVYLNLWVCIGIPYWTPWDGWECLGYEIEEPFAPSPLAALLYGAVFHYIARSGECFGMSSTALKQYHGDVDTSHFDQEGVTDWNDLEREGEMKRYIQEHQGAQLSAEVLNDYLDTLLNGLVPSSDLTGMGVLIDVIKSYIDSGELGIISMIEGDGAHAVVPYDYEDTGDRVRFYVYDCNKEVYTKEEDANWAAWNLGDENDNPPYIEIERDGIYWDWTYDWVGGGQWSSNVGLGFVPYSAINGDRTLPLSVSGIFNLLMGSAVTSIEDDDGNVSGVDDDGELLWGIPDAAPLPVYGGEGFKPTSYFLPVGNYTTNISGTEDGSYNWSIINNATSAFHIDGAEVKGDSEDSVEIRYPDGNPYLGEMTYSSKDDSKQYDGGIIHNYGPRYRTFDVKGAELSDDGQHGDGKHFMKTTPEYDGIVFTNMGGGATTFDVVFTTNVMSEDVWNGTDRPGPGYLPTCTRSGITVGPGETVTLRATNWLDLNNSMIYTGDEGPPGPISNLVLNEVGGQVELSWDPPVDDGGWPVVEYEVFRGNATVDPELIGTSNTTSFFDGTTERGETYSYSVRALNILGTGALFPVVNISIPVITAPTIPLNFAGSYNGEDIQLTWDPPSDDGGSPFIGYRIFKGTTSGELELLEDIGFVSSTYLDEDIEKNMTYFYQILAYNAIGDGALSEEISVTVPPDEPGPGDTDTDTDVEEDDFPWAMVLVIGIAVLILIILLFVFMNRKGDYPEE